jgi:hydrogenase/urease accessory protein HupE
MRYAVAALFALAPAVALAHEGHHEQMGLAQSVQHLLTQPDHQLALAGLVVALVAGGWTWRRARVRK